MKRDAMKHRIESFKHHFVAYKSAYFMNRGFITFNTHKMACEMKEIFKKAFKDRSRPFLDKLWTRVKNIKSTEESPLRRRFRRVVLQKVIAPNSRKNRDPLTRAVKMLFGSTGSIFTKKVNLMRNEVGEKFDLNRGVPAEEINWSYIPEKKIEHNRIIAVFTLSVLGLPLVMYFISVKYYQQVIDKMSGVEEGVLGFISNKLLFVSMLGIDQGALKAIEILLPTTGFLKEHQMVGLKFIFTNLYFLSSGLFFLILGMVVAANEKMANITDEKEQYRITKQLLDSFYLTFIALIFTNLNSHILMPAFQFYYKEKGVPVKRDITYGLSFMCLAVYYVGFFTPFDINIIPIMCVSVLVLTIGEFVLQYRGIVQPERISFTILGNYLSALVWGLLPITLSAYMMLSGNKMGIKTMSFSLKDWLYLSAMLLMYSLLVSIFTMLYKNERLLKRVQSKIWTVNADMSNPNLILGSSYRDSNPVYSFEEKLKSE